MAWSVQYASASVPERHWGESFMTRAWAMWPVFSRVCLNVEEARMLLRGLRQIRQRNGLSISQLADMTGLKRETITHLEQCKEEPQPYVIRRLGSALGVSTAELTSLTVLPHEHLPVDPPVSSRIVALP